jgi:TrmH family RNA methyltransferase
MKWFSDVTADFFQRITSARNPRLKQAIKLRQPRARARQGRILIDGEREIALALRAGVEVDELFVDFERLGDAASSEWLRMLAAEGILIWALTAELLGKLGYAGRDDQPVATARAPHRVLSELPLGQSPLLVVLEGIEKPGNVGAIVRTADGADADGVIIADGRTDLFNPNAIRASRGTLFSMPLCAASAGDVVAWLRANRLQVCVARVDAERTYDSADLRQGTAIVLGSETLGVTSVWHDASFHAIRLPMAGAADSLNVSATAAVLLYEANRQRRAASGQPA